MHAGGDFFVAMQPGREQEAASIREIWFNIFYYFYRKLKN
jgi:hypothetical protein